MNFSQKEFLSTFGWDDFFENQFQQLNYQNLVPARIVCEEKKLYRVQLGVDLCIWAGISGKMLFNAKSREDFPAVGDWVLLDLPHHTDLNNLQSDERGVIQAVLKRKSLLHRKQIGSSADMQILSTNVDYVFITSSLNEDLNLRRLERYLAITRESGALPVILLTKSDQCKLDLPSQITGLQNRFPEVKVHSLCQAEFSTAEFLKHYLQMGKTSVFIGSSGVGKSTLINFLINVKDDKAIKTQEIRADDSKGRHTTTSRNLYVSRFGGLVIDTPGMRELQMSSHAEGLSNEFEDIEALVLDCRYSDCQHQTEPECAILSAIERDELDLNRWKNYEKLQAELRYSLRRKDKVLMAEERKQWKKRSQQARSHNIRRERYGG